MQQVFIGMLAAHARRGVVVEEPPESSTADLLHLRPFPAMPAADGALAAANIVRATPSCCCILSQRLHTPIHSTKQRLLAA
jgi:hypothetical protein